MTAHPLDGPVWAALTGPHEHLAERVGAAVRYRPDIAPFAALACGPRSTDPAAWADLAKLTGPGQVVVLSGADAAVPPGWELVERIPALQMDGTGVRAVADAEAVDLGAADVEDMLDLVARTRPGPFRPRTRAMGRYLGIRLGGALVAMAGQRLDPPGWSEISAVCTDPEHRGRGLAGRLVRAVAVTVRDAGDIPFLHVAAFNATAIRLYEGLGFTLRQEVVFSALRTPVA